MTLKKPVFSKVAEIDPNARGLNLVLKCTQVQGCEAKIVDETGVVNLRLKNDQKCQVGDTLILRNARVSMFEGRLRLEIDKWGKMGIAEFPANFHVKSSFDVSAVEYELVDF